MEVVQKCVFPLTPYEWEVHTSNLDNLLATFTPGSSAGKVGQVVRMLEKFQMQFEMIVHEFDHPYKHPAFDAYHKHPFHTCYFNKRQFDLLRYGMVLDRDAKLILVAAPHHCADSGTCVAREYEAVFHEKLNVCGTPIHPLLPEYCLVVYQFGTNNECTQDKLNKVVCENGKSREDNKQTVPNETQIKESNSETVLNNTENGDIANGNNNNNNNNDVSNDDNNDFPIPLFKLLFRNESYHTCELLSRCQTSPLFRLRAVLVSDAYYSSLRDITEFRSAHGQGLINHHTNKILPHPHMEKMMKESGLLALCDKWIKVLCGISPLWEEHYCDPLVLQRSMHAITKPEYMLSNTNENKTSVENSASAANDAVNSNIVNSATHDDMSTLVSCSTVDNKQILLYNKPLRLSYSLHKERMQERVLVLTRERGMLNDWQDGMFNLKYYDPESNGPEPLICVANCVRLLLCPYRSEKSVELIDNELCGYVPQEHEYVNLCTYLTPAANKLHLWILKALMRSEEHNVHVVMLEVDPTLLLSQCTRLLWGDEEVNEYQFTLPNTTNIKVKEENKCQLQSAKVGKTNIIHSNLTDNKEKKECVDDAYNVEISTNPEISNRRFEAYFHVCKILVETVEAYMQQSGNLWRVILCINERERTTKNYTIINTNTVCDTNNHANTENTQELTATVLCEEMLSLIQSVKLRLEQEAQNVCSNKGDEETIINKEYRTKRVSKKENEPLPSTAKSYTSTHAVCCESNNSYKMERDKNVMAIVKQNNNPLTLYNINTIADDNCKAASQSTINYAKAVGLKITDEELYPLFINLCECQAKYYESYEIARTLRVTYLVKLMLPRLTDHVTNNVGVSHWPFEHPLLSLDACGVMWDKKKITNFVMGFTHQSAQSRLYNSMSKITKEQHNEDSINAVVDYLGFSLMMLALARL